ncbi:8693_t:CDS:2 [Entrophospora sp. SA101]|nr:8693_t:CDS:2 [Entrophospora sp. SA101]
MNILLQTKKPQVKKLLIFRVKLEEIVNLTDDDDEDSKRHKVAYST